MWAAWGGRLDVVRLLVGAGADPSRKNGKGCTVAHWAAGGADGPSDGFANDGAAGGGGTSASDGCADAELSGCEELLDFLADSCGVDFSARARNAEGNTPLTKAVAHGNVRAVNWILARRTKLPAADSQPGQEVRVALSKTGPEGCKEFGQSTWSERERADEDCERGGTGEKDAEAEAQTEEFERALSLSRELAVADNNNRELSAVREAILSALQQKGASSIHKRTIRPLPA